MAIKKPARPTKQTLTGVSKKAAPASTAAAKEPKHFPTGSYDEKGTLGLETYSGFVGKAYHADLYWPGVFPLYNRLRRSDPEVTIIRQIFSTVASSVRIEFELPEKPSNDDRRFAAFGNSVLADMEGGIGRWRDSFVSYVPFMGWAWWEAVPGLRQRGWRPPDPEDEWRSQFNDGLVGFRRLAFRDHSSFDSWDLSDGTGRLKGIWQNDMPNPRVRLPLKKSLHVVFGDMDNPEGLTPLEALWRLERIKFGLEVVQGIGYEHAAGYLSVTKTEKGDLGDTDKANIKAAARGILTAQEGNYAAWPFGFTGEVKDVPFGAATSILAAIQHYSTLKLALYNMQWVAMSTTSGTGSYAALKDSTALWLVAFNAMMAGGVEQADKQIGERLYLMNRLSFPNITQRPKLKATKVEKLLDLQELAEFMSTIKAVMPLGDEDYIEVRKRSGFLPESLPTAPESTPVGEAEVVVKPGEMAAAREAATHRVAELESVWAAELAELSEGKPGARLSYIFTELQKSFDGGRAEYRETVYLAVLSYLVQGGAGSRSFGNRVKRAIVEQFPAAFYEAYVSASTGSAGGDEVDREDDDWLTAKINAELGFVDLMFESLKGLKDERVPPSVYEQAANDRADGYVRTLEAVFVEGRLRGAKNKMLTMDGDDGLRNCKDCKRRKGMRLRAKTWLARGWVPGIPGNEKYECKGYQCYHFLRDDDGVRWAA